MSAKHKGTYVFSNFLQKLFEAWRTKKSRRFCELDLRRLGFNHENQLRTGFGLLRAKKKPRRAWAFWSDFECEINSHS